MSWGERLCSTTAFGWDASALEQVNYMASLWSTELNEPFPTLNCIWQVFIHASERWLTRKFYELFIWNANWTGCPIFSLVTLSLIDLEDPEPSYCSSKSEPFPVTLSALMPWLLCGHYLLKWPSMPRCWGRCPVDLENPPALQLWPTMSLWLCWLLGFMAPSPSPGLHRHRSLRQQSVLHSSFLAFFRTAVSPNETLTGAISSPSLVQGRLTKGSSNFL